MGDIFGPQCSTCKRLINNYATNNSGYSNARQASPLWLAQQKM